MSDKQLKSIMVKNVIFVEIKQMEWELIVKNVSLISVVIVIIISLI